MNQALLLIDIQNDYFPGGGWSWPAALRPAPRPVSCCGPSGRKHFPSFTFSIYPLARGLPFSCPTPVVSKSIRAWLPAPDEIVIQKNFPNSFRGTPLLDHLRERDVGQLVIGGMMTHMCIDSTTRAAADLGFECFLARDACATKTLSFGGETIPAASVQTAFLASLNGLFAKVQSVDELCASRILK